MNNLTPEDRAFSKQRWSSRAKIFLPGLSVVLVLTAFLVPLATSLLGKHQAHASSTPSLSIDQYICGSDVQRPSPPDNFWDDAFDPNAVPDPNHWVYNSMDGIWVQAIGWQGGSCSGNYWFGWDQYYHKAQWVFDDYGNGSGGAAHIGTICSVAVFIPPWFFGAPDARYSLSISSYTSGYNSQEVTFAPLNQNDALDGRNLSQTDPTHDPARWVTLTTTDGHAFFALTIPRGSDSAYHFALTLREGGAQGWYLGADAAYFVCAGNP